MAKGGSKGNQKPVRDYGNGAMPNNGATPATWQQHYGNGNLRQERFQDLNQQQGQPGMPPAPGMPAGGTPAGSYGDPTSMPSGYGEDSAAYKASLPNTGIQSLDPAAYKTLLHNASPGMPAPDPGMPAPAVQPEMPPAPGQSTERDAYRDAMRDRKRGRFQDRNGPQSPQTPEQQGYTGLPADGSAPPMGYNGPPMQGIQGYTGPNGGQQSGQGMSGQALRDWWNQRRGNNGGGQQPLSGQPLRDWWNRRRS